MAPPLLEARGLVKEYRVDGQAVPVLSGVDLALRAGESLAILGTSGAGKSTLLHLLGLLDRPTSGTVLFEGRDTGGFGEAERALLRSRSVGFVFQMYHLLPELTARENVYLPDLVRCGRAEWRRRRPEVLRRADEVLSAVGLSHRAVHRPNQLSGGERQRVAIGRALFNRPAILLCDEPTGNLDQRTSVEIVDLLFRLRAQDACTLVLVTHNAELGARADRTVRLAEGRIR